MQRANHIGTQAASTISDLTEAIQDAVGAMATDSATVDFTYDDVAGTLTAVVQGLTAASISDFAEAVDDRVATLLVAGANVTLTYDDVAGTLTVAAATQTGTTNLSYDAGARTVASDTGTDAVLPLADGTNAGLMASADKTKLDGVEAGATTSRVTIPADVTASHVATSADANASTGMDSASALTVTINTGVFTAGDLAEYRQVGAGQVTVAAGVGVTLRAPNGAKTRAQYSPVQVLCLGGDVFSVTGDTTT